VRDVTATALIVSLLVLSVSCSYHRAHFYHADYADGLPMSEFAWEGERLGPVAANEGGAIWNDCTKSARGTVWLLTDRTRKLAGH
jgi:hypothetical protein